MGVGAPPATDGGPGSGARRVGNAARYAVRPTSARLATNGGTPCIRRRVWPDGAVSERAASAPEPSGSGRPIRRYPRAVVDARVPTPVLRRDSGGQRRESLRCRSVVFRPNTEYVPDGH